jgi:hypothetical protein
MPLDENLANRSWLVKRLRAEVVGPDPVERPEVLLEPGSVRKLTKEEFYRKRKAQPSGEEILWQDPPAKRYGAGILHPVGVPAADVTEASELRDLRDEEARAWDFDEKQLTENEKVQSREIRRADDSEDYDVTLANAFRPSAIGLSFLADFDREDRGFSVELVCVSRLGQTELHDECAASYKHCNVKVGDPGGAEVERSLWFRIPLRDEQGRLPRTEIFKYELTGDSLVVRRKMLPGAGRLQVSVVSRPWGERGNGFGKRLLTVSIVHRGVDGEERLNPESIYQSGLRVRGLSSESWIVPYPDIDNALANCESDEAIARLLYREHLTYAIGHGCAADWQGSPQDGISEVWSDVLPSYETAPTTADLQTVINGELKRIRVSMRKLAGLDSNDSGSEELEDLVAAYEKWINELESSRPGVSPVPTGQQETARHLIARCRRCLTRIRDGLALLADRSAMGVMAQEAFRLANQAMLIARLRSDVPVRMPRPSEGGRIVWSSPIVNPDPSDTGQEQGFWRPFQIAFLLMSLRGICEDTHADREVVDLIWFPTGGGKTEAYLGLTAFAIFFNRLSGRKSDGVDVLMRYTLRLLTAQQFQRAALLFCAIEHMRRKRADLGVKPFRLGLWVGGDTTPNSRADALRALRALERNFAEENPFVLLKCPWCGARFGPNEQANDSRHRRATQPELPSVAGYYRHGIGAAQTVVYRCPDYSCEFGLSAPLGGARDPLPVTVIDEDMIASPPSLLIGTVDKFAMLAWKPELRRLFGIGPDGQHENHPPTLIIQDELHLISGPLGTMVGAYETLIDRLCREHGIGAISPKIVASTATISRASEQIRHLYARDNVSLFPPSGLEAGDSFFAKEDRTSPGRLYLGILAPGHGSSQTTQARVYAALMQYSVIMDTDDAGRDPWWTLLCFFNSLRELGGASTLFISDARDYLRVIIDRHSMNYEQIRSPFATELTSRIRSDEIPKELAKLEIPFSKERLSDRNLAVGDRAVDVCLASNIIEVGVDIPRLSLMAIVGQPKTTSQYIQVSSRVGRHREKPGLVCVLYGQSKPRDRSHYERFRTYHQRLYAQVEPTSVTPFSLPAVDRALHGLVVAAVRQLGELQREGEHPDPFPLAPGGQLREIVEEMIRSRVEFVTDGEDTETVMGRLRLRLSQWQHWNPAEYGGFGVLPEHPPLMYPAGANPPPDWNNHSWPTLSSLRDVDASCEAEITDWFNSGIED